MATAAVQFAHESFGDAHADAAGVDVLAQKVILQDEEGADVALFRIRGEHDTMGNLLTAFLGAQADVVDAAYVPERELCVRLQTAPGSPPPRAALQAAVADAIGAMDQVELAAMRAKAAAQQRKNGATALGGADAGTGAGPEVA